MQNKSLSALNCVRSFLVLLAGLSPLTVGAATIEVTAQIGDPGCDLVEAINAANADTPVGDCIANNGSFGDDLIVLNFTVPISEFIVDTVNFNDAGSGDPFGLPEIRSKIRILGRSANANTLIKIKRSESVATPDFALFRIASAGDLSLENISLQNGRSPESSGGALNIAGGDFTSIGCEFKNNLAAQSGAIAAAGSGTLTIRRSLFVDNRALSRSLPGGGRSGAPGGAISIFGEVSLAIYDSTLSGNVADDEGGAIQIRGFRDGVNVSIVNTTISNNQARSGGGISLNIFGRPEDGPSDLILVNSIVSGNSASFSGAEIERKTNPPTNDRVGIINSILGHAEFSSTQAIDGTFDLSNAIVATNDGDTPTPLNSIIRPLANNDGRTRTHALPIASPAVDAATAGTEINAGLIIFYLPGCRGERAGPISPLPPFRPDQRGVERPNGDTCDIGAYELEPDESQCFVVKTSDDKVVTFCL